MQLHGTDTVRFGSVGFVVGEHVNVAQYARALGITEPTFASVAAARERDYAARPVVPALLGFMLTVTDVDLTERLGFTWGKTLNSAIDVEWSGLPVTEEDELTGTSAVESCWERAGRDRRTRQFLRLRTDFTRGDTLVCRWRVLFMETRDGEPDPDLPHEEVVSSPGDPFLGSLADNRGDTADHEPGELPSHTTPVIDRLVLARLSVALDNSDPVHLDDDVARAAGFDQVIGHGAAVVGLLHEPVRRWAGLHAPVRMSTRQRAPFGLGNHLVASGHRPSNGYECTTAVHADDGTEIGGARVEIVPRR